MAIETERRKFDGKPNSVAVVEKNSGRIVRWEKDPERRNPIEGTGTMRARNPSELATADRMNAHTHNHTTSTMERQNQAGDYVATSLSLVQTGSVIFAGQLFASYAFGYIDEQLKNQNKYLRMAVNILGPAVAGGVLYNSTKNEYLRAVALGHAIDSGSKIVNLALGTLFPQDSGSDDSNVDTDGSETNGSDSGTQGLTMYKGPGMMRRNGMSGGFSADQKSTINTTGGMGARNRQTVMQGA